MSPPGDRLKLADPQGTTPDGNAALDRPSLEDKIAERAQLADSQKRIAQLERSNAALERRLDQQDKAAQAKAGGHGKARHMAHAEGWLAVCTAPDFCKVGKDVVAFNSFATLDKKHTASSNVKARGSAVYRKGDIIKNVQADAGQHVVSGTSLGSGHVKILDGHDNVKVNGIPVARHDSRCLINCDASGVGGAQGKLVTEQKSVGGGAGSPSKDAAPPGERTSEKLEALKKARAGVAGGMLNLDAIDEYVDFKRSNEAVDDLIAQISGTEEAASGYAAQLARGLLGFGKDIVLGSGELAYEAIKAMPKLVQLSQTQSGKLLAQLDAQILAETIKLGNITSEGVGQGALNIGKAIVKPVTDPWAKGQYVESVTRGATEVGLFGFGWLKGSKAARAAKAAEAAKVADAAKAADAARAADAVEAAKPARANAGHVDDGVHVAGQAAIIANRQRLAEDFYLRSGTPQSKIHGHLAGIDFTKPVEVVTMERGALLGQYQVPGAPQGAYYSPLSNGSSPASLGIFAQATDRATGTIIEKASKAYEVKAAVEMLRSTAAPILDTWSIPGAAMQTKGGAIQLFSSSNEAFVARVR
jgi:uncharacterized Zn-binding protein involved in type VI secretion